MEQYWNMIFFFGESWLIVGVYGGFHSHGGIPIAGWFISWKIPYWMRAGAKPISGNLQLGSAYPSSPTSKTESYSPTCASFEIPFLCPNDLVQSSKRMRFSHEIFRIVKPKDVSMHMGSFNRYVPREPLRIPLLFWY